MPTVISGKLAKVNGITQVAKWTVSKKETNDGKYVASNTKGATGRVQPNEDWSGTIEVAGLPHVFAGTTLALELYADSLNAYVGNAIIDKVDIKIDQATAAPIKATYTFSSNGALAATPTAVIDIVPVDVPGSKLCKVMWCVPGDTPAELVQVKSVDLSFISENKPYIDTSTNGQTYRVVGNLDANCSIIVNPTILATLPAIGTVWELQIDVNIAGTNYYDIQWMQVQDISGIDLNVETAEVVSATIKFGLNAWNNSQVGNISLVSVDPYDPPVNYWP
jgi:hypothetical protein